MMATHPSHVDGRRAALCPTARGAVGKRPAARTVNVVRVLSGKHAVLGRVEHEQWRVDLALQSGVYPTKL